MVCKRRNELRLLLDSVKVRIFANEINPCVGTIKQGVEMKQSLE